MARINPELQAMFEPVLADVAEHAKVTDRFIDKDRYRIMIATLWANVVLRPSEVGLTEGDLEGVHDVLNSRIAEVLGADQNLTACFEFLNSKSGERAMQEAKLTQNHKDLLAYFASMILDPEGHRRWMDNLNDPSAR